MTPLRLVFMGTPDFAVPSLRALADAGHEVVCVYSQPPRPAGRGQQVQKSPVHRFAEERGIPVRTPKSLRNAEAQAEFAELKADAAVVAAYGLILPQPILDAPRLGCLNVHGSLLPRWRGAAPIQRAILAGDAETGITIMQMDIGLDTGAMLLKDAVPITAETTASSLHDALADMGARLIVEALDGLAAGRLTAEPQPEAGVTYAAKLTREDGRLDWTRDAAFVERQVRALTPWPGCWFDAPTPTGGVERIKVLKAEPVPASTNDARQAAPGTLLDDRLTIACADGAVRLTLVQRPGKAPVDGAALLRGFALPVGTRLGDAACSAGN
ncbi:methionyl-tRNA formyltransferase [Azospirillum himalayense]|uniref:Methionyl-tRNA formyltransferase n=1 Tax=Azospirillum himalayense TaxID=654847 RepID=A0ABW0G4H4_9PROT